jgi:formyltetrahydrofolate deformylase
MGAFLFAYIVFMKNTAILLISCPDQKGISAAIANFLLAYNANIVHADQHQDTANSLFLMRVEWDLTDFTLALAVFPVTFAPIAKQFQMQWRLALSQKRQQVAIFVSKYDHCLVDLLHRHHSGELACDIPLVISNHEDCRRLVEFYGVRYHVVSVGKSNKQEAEASQMALLQTHHIDLVILARYMQVLSSQFTAAYPQKIINIHHSFLPAFDGAKPYHRAFERGVKRIGATSHYVTEVLDDGPIIEQDVVRISHRDEVEDLIQKGRDLERVVLSRAVQWHLESRVLVYNNKTVIFD